MYTTSLRSLFVVSCLAASLAAQAQAPRTKKATKPAVKKETPVPSQDTMSETPTDSGSRWDEANRPEKSASYGNTGSGEPLVRQDYWQPGESKHGLAPSFTYASVSGSKNSVDFKTTSTTFGVKYLYGISDDMAAGLSLSYSSMTVKVKYLILETDTKYDGLGDLYLRFVGKHEMGATLHYGANLGISPGERKFNSTDAKGNNYSGGISLDPNIGISNKFGNMYLGVDLKYSYKAERKRKNEPTATETTITGGNQFTLSAFGEMVMESFQPGVELQVGSVDKTKYKTGTTETESDTVSLLGLNAYGRFALTDTAQLVPMIGYIKIAQDTSAGNIEQSGFGLGIEGRFTF